MQRRRATATLCEERNNTSLRTYRTEGTGGAIFGHGARRRAAARRRPGGTGCVGSGRPRAPDAATDRGLAAGGEGNDQQRDRRDALSQPPNRPRALALDFSQARRRAPKRRDSLRRPARIALISSGSNRVRRRTYRGEA